MAKIVLVEWVDITTYSDRHPLGNIPKYAKLTLVKTVGILIEKTKEMIVIAHQVYDIPYVETYASEFTAIPLGCIKSIKELK